MALVGATSPSGVTSCQVFHDVRYDQKRIDNTIDTQLLRPHTSTIQCPHIDLQLAGVSVVPGNPLTAPQALPLWGRAVAGQWNLSIPDSEFLLHGNDLSNLAKIEIWLTYQFLAKA